MAVGSEQASRGGGSAWPKGATWLCVCGFLFFSFHFCCVYTWLKRFKNLICLALERGSRDAISIGVRGARLEYSMGHSRAQICAEQAGVIRMTEREIVEFICGQKEGERERKVGGMK